MYCTKCGAQNEDVARVCVRCGAALGQIRAYQSYPQTVVPTYLAQAILVTLFCCLPFGIPAIVFAAQVNSKLTGGDYAGALESSRKAKTWCWVAFCVGLPLQILVIIFQIVLTVGSHAYH